MKLPNLLLCLLLVAAAPSVAQAQTTCPTCTCPCPVCPAVGAQPPAAIVKVWYVALSGLDTNDGTAAKPLRTPRVALRKANPGEVVELAAGTYGVDEPTESYGIVMDRPGVTLRGQTGALVVLQPASARNTYGIMLKADGVALENVTVTGFVRQVVTFGRTASTQKNVRITKVVTEGGTDGIRAVVVSVRPNPQPLVDGLVLTDVTIRRPALVGFNCGEGPCNNVTLDGVRVEMAAGGSGSGADGIAFESGDGITIRRSFVTGASADGIDLKATNTRVSETIVQHVKRNGIKLWYGGEIVNCIVANTGADAAIVFEGGGDFRLVNSVVALHAVGTPAYALTAGYNDQLKPATLLIANSIFYKNSGPVWVSPGTIFNVDHVDFFGNGDLDFVASNGRTFGKLGKQQVADLGPGVLAVDPMFVGADDFHLANSSLLIDAGTAAVPRLPVTDIGGRLRTGGPFPDLGAWEH